MKFSTKTRYGIRTMMEIARHTGHEGIYQKDIAEKQNLSVKYLDHIIHALKVAGLITPVRGRKSGYILTRPPSEISMLDIHLAFDPGIHVIDCLSEHVHCNKNGHCAAQGFWESLNHLVIDHFSTTSLEDLVHEQQKMDGH
ncbi:MAG TPA: Rrf2 family transcriptional regulator [Bacteroidetes bacterium]|nr:Rrf2 family transcriptional regulator [Bacteroidota bacterium]